MLYHLASSTVNIPKNEGVFSKTRFSTDFRESDNEHSGSISVGILLNN